MRQTMSVMVGWSGKTLMANKPIAMTTMPHPPSSPAGYRSASRPVNGEHTSWASENEATSRPAWVGEAPSRSEYAARTGKSIPKPMRSSATVVQITPKPGGILKVGLQADPDFYSVVRQYIAENPQAVRVTVR